MNSLFCYSNSGQTRYNYSKTNPVSLYGKKSGILFILLLLLPFSIIWAQNPIKTFSAGSYVIDMGVEPQTFANGLKPYGLIYDLILNHSVPISWSINSSKSKDGIDFNANGKDFKGGPFIIAKEYIKPAVIQTISNWVAKGVVVYTIPNEFSAPVFHSLTSWPRAVLDQANGNIVRGYYQNAEIPTNSYITAGNPSLISNCEDIYVLPHADIGVWTTAYKTALDNFIKVQKGYLWSACTAVSQIENLPNSNYLSIDGLIPFLNHITDWNEKIPYDYAYSGEPIMQFLGRIDEATNKGSERIYIPKTDWASHASKAVYDNDHGTYPVRATALVFGRAFGNPDYGMVMYESGHDHNDDYWNGTINRKVVPIESKVAAQRAYFNFVLLTGKEKEIAISSDIPGEVYAGKSITLTATANGGVAPYIFNWSTNNGGFILNQSNTATQSTITYIAPSSTTVTEDVITLKVTDNCITGRFSLISLPVPIIQTDAPTGNSPQTFCEGATVGNLVAVGTDIKWYSVSEGGTPLSSGDLLVNNTIYYASQTQGGNESAERLAVLVFINLVDSGSIPTLMVVCNNTQPDIIIEESPASGSGTLTYQWYVRIPTISPIFAQYGGGTSASLVPIFQWQPNIEYKRVTYSTLNGKVCEAESNILIITVDNIPPTVTGSINSTFISGCNVSDAPAAQTTVAGLEALSGNLSISDNNSADDKITVTSTDDVSGNCPIVISRTYKVKDECGNLSTGFTHIITINDTQAPIFTGSLNPLNIDGCSVSMAPAAVTDVSQLESLSGNLLISDNCTQDTDLIVSHTETISGSCPIEIIRKYKITDECGNISEEITHSIYINDTEVPIVTGALTQTNAEGCDAGAVTTAATTVAELETMNGNVLVSDNCSLDENITVTYTDSESGSCPLVITRNYLLTDQCGNTNTDIIHIINIADTQAPIINGNLNQTTISGCSVASAPAAATTVAELEALDGNLSIIDACSPDANITVSYSDYTSGSCPIVVTRTYTVTDECLNTSLGFDHIIYISDSQAPIISGAINTTTIEGCDIGLLPPAVTTVAELEALAGNLQITDACSTDENINLTSTDFISGTCPIIIIRTYTLTDECGNATQLNHRIQISDTTPPTASKPNDITVQCMFDAVIDLTVVDDEADNCTASPTVNHLSDVQSGQACPLTIVRTYRITDNCGNYTDVSHNIYVLDDVLPTASNPSPISVQCVDDVPNPNISVVTDAADNCAPNPVVAFVGDASNGNPCPQIITRTYSATDDCGNTFFVTQQITVDDNINPTASNPLPINVQCIGEVPAPDITVVTNEADNCTANPAVAFVSDVSDGNACPEIITRTYSVTDDCGNSINVTQQITIGDNINPTASNPAPIYVQCFGEVPLPDITVVTDESDNCTANPTVAFVSDISDGNTCPEIITRTYSVTDDCGNSITVTQQIIINDDTNPTATNPAPISVQCIDDVPLPDITVVTDKSDNCTANPTVAYVGDVSNGNTCPEIITRTYSVTDDCGNSIIVTQQITILDDIPPTASNPLPLNSQCYPAPDITVVTDEADNCTSNPIVAFVGDVSDGNTCPELITRTYSVTDDCGNSINVTQQITILDDIPPTASNPLPLNSQCYPAPDITLVTDEADNCTSNPIVAFVGDVSDGNTCPELITRTYSVTDDCGNSINVTQQITILDDIPPSASNLTQISVQCKTDVPLPDINLIANETDNCSSNPTVAFVSDVSDGNSCPELITRTYSVTDDCGNSITVTQQIIINDDINPTATNPAPISVQCIDDVPLPDINIVTDEADNCTANPTVAFVSDVSDGNSCPELITRTYSVTDDCGNSIMVTQQITVDDTINPTATNSLPINVQCIGDVPSPDITAVTDESDNCTANPTVAFVSDVSDGNNCPEIITRNYSVTDDCGNSINVSQQIIINDDINPTASNPSPTSVQCISDIPLVNIDVVIDEADNCTSSPLVEYVSESDNGGLGCASNPYILTRIYRISDACNNSIEVEHTITVIDDTAPSGTAPLPVSLQCISEIPAVDVSVIQNVTDNCSSNPTVSFLSESDNGGSGCASNPYILIRTYQIEDDCGNTTNLTQTFTVIDNQGPIVNHTPEEFDRILSCEDAAGLAAALSLTPEFTDNCSPVSTITVQLIRDEQIANPNCPSSYIRIREWNAQDVCGNISEIFRQSIIVNDFTPPTATNPAPISVQCIDDVPVPDINIVTDEADNCTANPTVAFVSDVSDGNSCPELITRTYSVTDDCGNSIMVTQQITVDDTINPTATNPLPINVQCIGDVPSPDITAVTDESDNCTANPTVAYVSDVSDGNTCPQIITRTYSVTDDCGNSINVSQQIIINDDINPTASNPSPTSVQCISDIPLVNIDVVIDEADNCTSSPLVEYVSESDNGGLGCASNPYILTRIYRISDACNNSIEVEHTITVIDDTAPSGTAPLPVSLQCISEIPAVDVSVIQNVTDNCSSNPTVSFLSESDNGGSGCASNPYILIRTYQIEDDCGNTTNLTQTFTVIDNQPPVVNHTDGEFDVFLSCEDATGLTTALSLTPEFTDNCSPVSTITVQLIRDEQTLNPYCPNAYIRIREWTATDLCGNQSLTFKQTITVNDLVKPYASNLPDIIVECIEDLPSPNPALITDESDNCTAVPQVVYVRDDYSSEICPLIVTRTYRVSDECGNSYDVFQNIFVQDDTPPTATPPSPIELQCISEIPPVDTEIIANESDNCTGNPNVAFIGETDNNGNGCKNDPYILSRTYRVTDNCGNYTDYIHQISVIDTIKPAALTPAAIQLDCKLAIPAPDINVVEGVSDNCTANPTVSFLGQGDNGGSGCVGDPYILMYTYRIADDCGNYYDVEQQFTIVDDQVPVVTTTANELDVVLSCEDVAGLANALAKKPSFLDNCTLANDINIFKYSDNTSYTTSCTDTYIRVIEWVAEDACGNRSAIYTQTIEVRDLTPPTASNPASFTVQCFEEVTAPNPLDVIDESDNCTANPIVEWVSDIPDALTCPMTILRTYRISDACGNSTLVTQNIIVLDETPPTASNLPTVILQCGVELPDPDIELITDEADNCTGNPIVEHHSDVSNNDPCHEIIKRTYRITDSCGNYTDVTQFFERIDTELPTASNPADLYVQCIEEAPRNPEVVIDEADNCTAIPSVRFYNEVSDGNICPEKIVRTYRIYDNCGNFIDVNQNIYINDITAPSANDPVPIFVECIKDVPLPNTNVIRNIADNCVGDLKVKFESEQNDGLPLVRTITRRYSITDKCGNQTIKTQSIHINGIPRPKDDYYFIDENSENNAFTVLSNDDFGCDGLGELSIEITVWPSYGTVIVHDNGSPFNPTDDYVLYTPDHNYYQGDSFKYAIIDKDGDRNTAKVYISIIPGQIFIPEGFSPNGDGVNDLFHIRGLYYYPDHSMLIFDKEGNTVWQAKPYLNDWNGTNQSDGRTLPQDTYFYIMELGVNNAKIKGFIYLVRKY